MKKFLLYAIISLLPTYMLGQACATTDMQQAAIIFTANGATSVGEAEFTLGKSTKVKFMLGNLQYQPSTDTWRIAARQYDYVGGWFKETKNDKTDLPKKNVQYGTVWEKINGVDTRCSNDGAGDDYAGWIDLFAFGTGDAHGTDIKTGETFRTPTKGEYDYLVKSRTNATQLRARGRIVLSGIGGAEDTIVNGLILLPDNWDPKIMPVGKTFKSDAEGCIYYTDNVFTEDEWKIIEAQGAIFLPAGGTANGNETARKYNRSGYYWTSTPNGGNGITLEFGGYRSDNDVPGFVSNIPQSHPRAIRLCQDVE